MSDVVVKPFTWDDWRALRIVRHALLAEDGIVLGPAEIPERPQPGDDDRYECDFHHMDEVYVVAHTRYMPGADEIRMQLEVLDPYGRT